MNKVYKAVLAVGAMAIVGGATLVPAAVNAWGDSSNGRPSYTISQINSGVLGDTITFNSISDGKIGDEKNFVGAKLSTDTGSIWKADEVTVKDGEVYTVRLYVHNNSPKAYAGVATGVTAQFSLPTTVGKSQTVIGYLTADNATPQRYWDEVKFVSDDNFYLEYVDGSARYTNDTTNGGMGTVTLSNNIITNSGVLLGYEQLDGRIPGCYSYDGVVTIQVKVHKSVSGELVKTVRLKGSGAKFDETTEAKIGDEVEFQIKYTNLLGSQVDNVMIRDVLPNNMDYVNGTTTLYNSFYQSGTPINENTVASTGLNIGSYLANANAYVRFTAKVVDRNLACGANQLVDWASATVNGEVLKDDASVYVTKQCAEETKPTPTPTPTPEPEHKEAVVVSNPVTTTPSTMPSTGPTEVAAGAVGAGSVVTALGYFIKSRKKLM